MATRLTLTHGPAYRTTDPAEALQAWGQDEAQWIFTDENVYLVGYAPQLFVDAPMAQGWHISSPEALERDEAREARWDDYAADADAELAYSRMLEDAERYAEIAAQDAAAEAAWMDDAAREAMETDLF